MRQGSSLQTDIQLFPELSVAGGAYNPTVVSRVELPNGQSYFFYYNSYGELARVILPTGGGYDFEHSGYPSGSGYDQANVIILRQVTSQITYKELSATDDPANPTTANVVRKDSYGRGSASGTRIITVETRNASDVLQATTKLYYYDSGSLIELPIYMPAWSTGKEFKSEYFQVSGGTVGSALKTVEHTWSPTPPGSSVYTHPNAKIIETKTTLNDVNLVAKQTFSNDSYHNQTEVKEYDFGSGSPGAVKRRTVTSYLTTNPNQGSVNYATDNSIHIRNLPTQVNV